LPDLDGSALALPLAAFLLAALIGLACRGLWPVDETRYVAVAWEMWWRGDWLLPRLLGEPYSHKPPLLFWLLHAGWLPWGVNDLWPRLLPWLLAAAQLLALRSLARVLAPDLPRLGERAIGLQTGLTLWMVWAGVLGFDVLLAICVIMALRPVALAVVQARPLAVLPLGGWLGLALLAKGPVAGVFVLPAALALPWLRPTGAALRVCTVATDWLRVLLAVLLAVGLAAAWALPAAAGGGQAYADAILWGQIAGRVVQSFAHREPWWWYLPWLPLLLFPWSLCPGLFAARHAVGTAQALAARRLLAFTVLSGLLVLSTISGKQLHYLVPLLPLAVLWLALRLPSPSDGVQSAAALGRALPVPPCPQSAADPGQGTAARAPVPVGPRAPALAVGLLGLILALVAAGWVGHARWPPWVADLGLTPPLAALALAFVGWRMAAVTHGRWPPLGPWLQGFGVLLLLQVGLIRLADTELRQQAILPHLQAAEAAGHGWAYLGGYAGEFDLAGRLRVPPALPADAQALADWAERAHPSAPVLRMFRGELPAGLPAPLLVAPCRGKRLGAWRAQDLRQSGPLRAFLEP